MQNIAFNFFNVVNVCFSHNLNQICTNAKSLHLLILFKFYKFVKNNSLMDSVQFKLDQTHAKHVILFINFYKCVFFSCI